MSDKTAYFGAITSELHNALINDPKPYRKEVKDLLSNTLFWIQDLGIDALVIDAPNHSQRVRIIQKKIYLNSAQHFALTPQGT